MITDATLVDLAAGIEAAGEAPTWEDDAVFAQHHDVDGIDVVVFRGSEVWRDWVADATAYGVLGARHPVFGPVHRDILASVERVAWSIVGTVGPGPVAFAGHSLGAAQALYMAALWRMLDRPFVRVAAFAPPRVGTLGGLLAPERCGAPVHLYRYMHDPVPELPPWLLHPLPVVGLTGPAHLLVVDDHHCRNYQACKGQFIA